MKCIPFDRRYSRRAWLQTGALALSAYSLASSLQGEQQAESKTGLADPKTGAIDAHVHVWTPDTERWPLVAGFRKEDMKPTSFTPEELFGHAGPCGVARIVLIQMSFYKYDNGYMLEAIRRWPGVFSGVAVIDPNQDRPEEQMRKLAPLGVRGFRLHPPAGQPLETWFASPGIAAMWKAGAETRQAMCLLINPDALPMVDGLCTKFSDTPVVIDHFARIGVDGTVHEADLERLCKLARHKHTHVKLSAFYALGKKQAPYLDLVPMIRRLLEAYGPERLMWATDCPFQVQQGHNYADSIALIRDRLEFLSAGDREWLLRKTAEKVYFS